jgi:benzaldehyde dehydrogenase (NAD)
VGKLLAQTCAKYLKPAILELGGKAPMVILDDADIDDAVNAATFGSFANSGQICMSTERIVVDEKIADEFVKRFANKAKNLPLGDPRKPEPVVLGSVIGMSTVSHCNDLIDDALSKGAKLLCGGKSTDTLMPATLLDHVTPAMRIYREESFAPVKAIVRVKGVEEAIACANDNEYGLSASVFGRDIARAYNVARKIDSAFATSMAPRFTTKRKCPLVASRAAATADLAAKLVSMNLQNSAGSPSKLRHVSIHFKK